MNDVAMPSLPLDGSLSMDLIAGLFQKQAKRLETQLLQQLQDKRVIEHIQAQLVATSNLVESLERQRLSQARSIEHNLQHALSVYERARLMRQQQIHLRRTIARLRADLLLLRGTRKPEQIATHEEPEAADDADTELPSIGDLLPGFHDAFASVPAAGSCTVGATTGPTMGSTTAVAGGSCAPPYTPPYAPPYAADATAGHAHAPACEQENTRAWVAPAPRPPSPCGALHPLRRNTCRAGTTRALGACVRVCVSADEYEISSAYHS